MTRASLFAVVLIASFLVGIAVAAPSDDKNKHRTVGHGQIKYKGKGPEFWHNRAAARYRQVKELRTRLGVTTRALIRTRRVTLMRPDALTAIRLASIAYDVDFDMLYRRASCESTGSSPASPPSNSTLYTDAKNPKSTAAGLFQFLDSTWASTPYAGFSVYSGYANALAAAWMMGPADRGGEWVCR